MVNRAYLEITNVCNLSCGFCHKTRRKGRFISVNEFEVAARRLRAFAEILHFHILGEPLLHPALQELLTVADRLGFKVNITTNGTLLDKRGEVLLNSSALKKVSISLHCYEVNSIGVSLEAYLDSCFGFCKQAAERGIVTVLRLWNKGGADTMNPKILERMKHAFNGEWTELYSGFKLEEYVFLEWGELFDWPDIDSREYGGNHSCYGVRSQLGVLCDGTVVPCCLDCEGAVRLGNIFESELSEILSGDRAESLKKSFQNRRVTEPLCRRCGYAMRFL